MLGFGLVDVGIAAPFAGGAAPVVSTAPPVDQPNPQAPRFSIDLRTWLQATPLNLLGQDTFYGGPGMGAKAFDYPNPRGYIPSIDLRTWAWGTPLNLAGKDIFFGVGGPTYDYPNPRAPLRAIDLISWVYPGPGLLHFMPSLRGYGFPNYDYPNPIPPRRAIDLITIAGSLNLNIITFRGAPALVYSVDLAGTIVSASDSPSGQGWKGLGYMTKYELDSSVQINGVFANAINDIYVDPSGVTLFVLDPAGALTSYQYTNQPSSQIIRDSSGHYHFTISPSKSGTWTYKWQATGTFIGTSPDTTFTVNASSLIAG